MVGWRWMAPVGGAVVLLTFMAVACGGDQEEGAALPTSTTAPGALGTVQAATATVANRPSPTAAPTETAALPLTATASPVLAGETGDGVPSSTAGVDPLDFRDFAQSIAQAAAGHDVAFFAGRVKGEPYTCTEGDIAGGGLGGAEVGLCEEMGQQLDLVLQCYWQSECVYTLPERLAEQINDYFHAGLPNEEDDLGSGEVRLLGVATAGVDEGERSLHTAILTTIAPLAGRPAHKPVRTALGIDFEYVERRWVVRGTLSAVFLDEALLEDFLGPGTGPYREVERY